MPSYEYQCVECEHVSLVRRVPVDQRHDPQDCELCGERAERLAVQKPGGFSLKGGGWYRDHYGLKGGNSGPS